MPQIQHYISPKKYTIIIAAISIIIVFVIGIITIKTRNQCILSSISLSDNWRYSDLRIIDPVEQENPDLELIAVYTRIACDQLQLRLDVLDYVPSHRSDILITFLDPSDVAPVSEDQPHIELVQEEEFTTTGITIIIPYDSDQQISNDNQYQTINKGMLVYIDTIQDAIYINLPLEDISSKTYPEKLFVMTKSSLDPNKTDSVGIIEITGTPPPPIPILLAFGDTFRANTPAQALRSWDGAHTGPDSTRHGLRHLLTAADRYNIPITLLDFDTPENFTALEYLRTNEWILRLKERGIVSFVDWSSVCNGYTQFTDNILQAGVSNSGLSPELLAALLNSTSFLILSPPTDRLCISLQNSYWGVPDAVDSALFYISQHPWMRPLNQGDIYSLSSTTSTHVIIPQEINPQLERLLYSALGELNNISTNHLTELARDEIAEMQLPGTSNIVQLHQEQYSHIGHIIRAAEWANSPTYISSCSLDIDWDGEAECILASNRIFASFELSGGYLAYMFYQGHNGIHQIVGLPSQLQSFNDGLPDTYFNTGAIGNTMEDAEYYQYAYHSTGLELFSGDLAIRKSFRVRGDTLEVNINYESGNHDLLIPVILDPWVLSKNNWPDLYSVDKIGEEWHLSLENLVSLRVSSASNATVETFLTPRIFMGYAEDPNQDYSQGYFLPFPLSAITLTASEPNNQEVKLELTVSTE